MVCERCVIEHPDASGSLDEFLEQLGVCDACPLTVGEGASPVVQHLVGRSLEAKRALRKLGQRVRAAESHARDLDASISRQEEKIAILEGVQKASAEASDAALRSKMELVEEKEAAILALSTPILHVLEGAIVLPLIGELDEKRAEIMTTTLLEEVSRSGATRVILDLTGIHALDAETAEHLLRVAQAARLLGAVVELTGLRSDAARAVIELGVDLSALRTRATLAQAIAGILRERKR